MQTVLSDVERRAVANLSIPRNAADLAYELRRDPYAPSLSESEVADLLEELEDDGLVVSLGDGRDLTPGELAAKVDSHSAAVSMPDEKAQIFEDRLSQPHRSWRLDGEVFVFTQDALDMLTDTSGAPVALDTAALSNVIRQELRRIKTFEDPSHPSLSLAQALTEEEFGAWHGSVVAEWKRRNGTDKVPAALNPMAGGAGYSDATELLILDPENGKGSAYTETAPWFMALTTVAVTDADTGSTITEANYTGYARKSVAAADMNSAAAGSASNANAIIFAACTAGTSTVIGFAKCVAATVGRLIKYGTCSSVTVSTTQTPAQFAAGAFTTTLD